MESEKLKSRKIKSNQITMKNFKKLNRNELKNVSGNGAGDWQLYCDPGYIGSGSPKGTCNAGYVLCADCCYKIEQNFC